MSKTLRVKWWLMGLGAGATLLGGGWGQCVADWVQDVILFPIL